MGGVCAEAGGVRWVERGGVEPANTFGGFGYGD